MNRKILFKAGIFVLFAVFAITILTVIFLMNASQPRAVLVYTQKENIPNVIFKISSVPLALSSYIKFGERKFAAVPATADNIESALYHSEFVVIGTHGIDGMVASDDGALIGPTRIANPKMKSIYFGSCYFGTQRKDWEYMFSNARVVGYDEKTYKLTGWVYLFFQSWIDLLTTKFPDQ